MAEDALTNPGEENETKKARIEALLKEAQEQMELKHELEIQLKNNFGPIKQIERELESIRKRQNAAKKQLDVAQQSLQEARDLIIAKADSAESEEARRAALLKKTEEDLSIARGKVDDLKQTQTTCYRKYEELEPHLLDAQSKIKGIEFQLTALSNKRRSLESSTGNLLTILGPRVERVARLVRGRMFVLSTHFSLSSLTVFSKNSGRAGKTPKRVSRCRDWSHRNVHQDCPWNE